MAAKPHVSAAIVQLRRWISAAAVVLCLALLTQLLVFGFVHYTDVRWTEVKMPAGSDLKVVAGAEPGPGLLLEAPAGQTPPAEATPTPAAPPPGRISAQEARARSVREAGKVPTGPVTPLEVNRVLTPTDRILRRASDTATAVGVVAAMALVALVWLGVAIAGGSAIPGVEKAVTACVWSMVLAGLALPIRDVFPSMLFPGILSGYESITRLSELARMGARTEASPVVLFGLMPAVGIACCVMVRIWFNDGVDRGVIYTSVSEIDEAMEREMAEISARGVQAGIPRAMGALNRAMGDTPEVSGATHPALRMAAGAESASEAAPAVRPRKRGAEEEYKRPI